MRESWNIFGISNEERRVPGSEKKKKEKKDLFIANRDPTSVMERKNAVSG